MKTSLTFAVLAAAAGLGACGQPADKAEAPPSQAASAGDAMAGMEQPKAPAAGQNGRGTGVVTAIDAAAGTVTLEHGPIPEVGWPAMTMAFKASPEVIASATVGDRVEFDIAVNGAASRITTLRPAPARP